jgi:hypothetical protein
VNSIKPPKRARFTERNLADHQVSMALLRKSRAHLATAGIPTEPKTPPNVEKSRMKAAVTTQRPLSTRNRCLPKRLRDYNDDRNSLEARDVVSTNERSNNKRRRTSTHGIENRDVQAGRVQTNKKNSTRVSTKKVNRRDIRA